MRNLEDGIRESLNRKADEAPFPHRDSLPPEIARRVHRRQARTALLGGAMLIVLASSVFALSRAWMARSPTEYRSFAGSGTPSNLPAPINTGITGWAELDRGTIDGRAWSLVTYKSSQGWCIEIQVERGSGGACGLELPVPDLSVGVLTQLGYPTFVNGAISQRVGSVRLESENGAVTEGKVYSPPDSLAAPFKVFLILLEKEGVVGQIIALDNQGNQLAREPLLPEPPLPAAEIRDVYGNLVGHVPIAPPPPPPGEKLRCSPELAPGTAGSGENTELIRAFACTELQEIAPQVINWWAQRPAFDASDETVVEWWGAYPLHEKVLQTVGGEDVIAAYDAYGNIWGYIPGGELDHTIYRAPPGKNASLRRIRDTANTRMVAVRELVQGWWESRPKSDAPDEVFNQWWESYPITEKLPNA